MDYEVREYFKVPFTRDELAAIVERSGMKVEHLVSTRSRPFRDRQLGKKTLTDDEWLDHMVAEPRLIRRPILVSDDGVEIGFKEARYAEIAERLKS